jgi:hypothetical protein|tara:strand:+ start:681 stop:1154 length:474 start_codon:yes stop_codon:yes gene_type:complete
MLGGGKYWGPIEAGEGNVNTGKYIHLSDDFKKCFKEAFNSEFGDKTFVLIIILVISQCNDTSTKKKEKIEGDQDLQADLDEINEVIKGKSVPKLSATALFFTTVVAKISVDLSTLWNKKDFFENYTNFLIASLLVVMLTYYLFMISNINLRLYRMFE